MTNIPRDLLCDPSEQLSARFLRDPDNLYGLHGVSTVDTETDSERWLPVGSRRYASLKMAAALADAESRQDEGLLPPIEPEVARWIGERVGALYQAVIDRFGSPVEELGPVTE